MIHEPASSAGRQELPFHYRQRAFRPGRLVDDDVGAFGGDDRFFTGLARVRAGEANLKRSTSPSDYLRPDFMPPLADLVMAFVTVDAAETALGATAFFGFLISRFERVWPLAIGVSFVFWMLHPHGRTPEKAGSCGLSAVVTRVRRTRLEILTSPNSVFVPTM